jgi:hypothetical protein
MALHRDEVAKAIALLKEINNGSSAWEDVSETSRRNNIVPGKMVFQDEKSDGGWEAIDLDIENITPEQMSIWEAGKGKIHNSSFIQKHPGNVTRIGFF